MASRPSIVFLFDLNIPSVKTGNKNIGQLTGNEVELTDSPGSSLAIVYRHVALGILNFFSEKHTNIQWSYRFYSSSHYQLTNKARFVDLSTQTLDDFEEVLNVCLEQNARKEVNLNHMSGAGVLSRTLQDVISDYDWKTPSDSLTPTRKGKKTGKQLLDHNPHNLVFVLTEVPSDETLPTFCRLEHVEPTIKTVSDAILPKELSKRFQELQINLNFLDLCYGQKAMFSKLVSNLRGAVLNAAALYSSPFSFSQILQASYYTEEDPLEECKSCQHLKMDKVLLTFCNDQIEFQVQCWNPKCSRSSLSSVDCNINNIPVIQCIPVSQSSFRSQTILEHTSLYLLSSKNNAFPNASNSSWIGNLMNRLCAICPLSSHSASMFFPTPGSPSYDLWTHLLVEKNAFSVQEQPNRNVSDFVSRFMAGHLEPLSAHNTVSTKTVTWEPLIQLKGNYTQKNRTHVGPHWELLKDCFKKEEQLSQYGMESNNNCFDQLPVLSRDDGSGSNDIVPMKIASSRIQNLRASTLLQKSQEVRAKHDKMEQEKDDKEKQLASDRREKMFKDQEAYLEILRSSIFPEEHWLQVVPVSSVLYSKQDIHCRCVDQKANGMTSQLEDWQLACLIQVIVSSLLYIGTDKSNSNNEELQSLEPAYEMVCKEFLKKPGAVSRLSSKEQKVFELKFQVLLRLELTSVVPSLVGLEENVIQETASLLQLLSIHSSPKIMSSFYQETLIFNYEGMLPEFLVFLGEELNQSIPDSLKEEVSKKFKSPSPAPSSKTLSVQSLASQQDMLESQRPATRDLRSRTLSRQPSLTVMQHKKQITIPTKASERNGVNAAKKEEPNEVGKVRRSLQFGSETPRHKTRNKSPTKVLKSPASHRLDTSFQPLLELCTPSKPVDGILAPETPSRLRSGGKSARKTDGVLVIGESPEVKQEGIRRSPRRLQAAMALRRRTSFYSSMNSDLNPEKGASRNWSRAESQVWSDKAKANVSIQVATEDNNHSSQMGQSAQFLFSRILSRNDLSPRKGDLELDTISARIPSMNTPLKSEPVLLRPPSTPSLHQRLAVPDLSSAQWPPGTPLKTPMKTPKQVQFNLGFQPATPSSKIVSGTKSILKSPMSFRSPCQNRTPRKVERESEEAQTLHVLDETSFHGRHQLELSSPVKVANDESRLVIAFSAGENLNCHEQAGMNSEVIHKLDEKTLQPDEEVELSPGKKLTRHRSPRRSPSYPIGNGTATTLHVQQNGRLLNAFPSIMADTNASISKVSGEEAEIGKHIGSVLPGKKFPSPSESLLLQRRSPRRSPAYSSLPMTNFFQHNPNWSVVDYRRPTIDGCTRVPQNISNVPAAGDPYEFDEELELQASRCGALDTSSHKRKLFQTSAEKPPSTKRRRLVPSPISESMKTPTRFQVPKESSLFHLENSPLLSTLEAKIHN